MTFQRKPRFSEPSLNSFADDHVSIIMAVYNGARCLRQQLDSISAQSHANWSIFVSDDGSTDGTDELLAEFSESVCEGQLIRLDGPRGGYANNFLSVLRRSRAFDSWLAFSDQDDVWMPDRLARGIAALSKLPDSVPSLYCSRTWIVDDALGRRRLSPPRPRLPTFRNALVQNVAAGNTILLNAAAAHLVQEASREVVEVIAHDWWVYQLIAGAGGMIVHDDTPTVLYRQHSANQIGANDGFLARMRRIAMILSGEYRRWNDVNVAALQASIHRLTPEHCALLSEFDKMRREKLIQRLRNFARLGLYRQTNFSTAALWVAVALGRF